ncbi:Protein of Unknown Function (DUF239 [Striga hermonthica]|uniref:Neprosin PEP catalytic domain-containing protein n=1 Tax=Striga hermonthica TaxID=68872 RepID=A0A9N7REW8_STRHE|nr:Protein of Unknown Function (DUF239 [Striga hermonthica]
MASSCCSKPQKTSTKPPIICTFVCFLFVFLSRYTPVCSGSSQTNRTFRPLHELRNMKGVTSYLRKINKPAVKTIQLWVISGSFANDLNTIEAGWQVSPELYGDNYPRFFTYWTTDAYQATGCYNLLCSGFVQINNKIAIGAAISPRSSYNTRQYDIGIMIWKDPKHGNWWLEFGPGLLVGYWPSFLFSHLQSHASMVQFGGEIVNSRSGGTHTSTQMGSGRFADEGFGKASYFRNLQVVDWDNNLIPPNNLHLLADHPNCYDIRAWKNNAWGTYFYYGGPGRNPRCQ